MDWQGRRESDNVEDRRGAGMGRTAVVGGGVGTLVLALVVMFLGGDPRMVLNAQRVAAPTPAPRAAGPVQESAAESQQNHFIRVVLADTEDVWNAVFREAGATYREPKLVLFRDVSQSACGTAESAMGPFYCPADEKVYLDLGFFDELQNRLGAQGEFARAYVVAHEVGHHVQNLLGVSGRVHSAQQRTDKVRANALSVRLELQADCLAGVWAARTQAQKNVLQAGDIESAMSAAAAVGDDRLQRSARGYVQPETFTHGSSEQRMQWFKRGLDAGQIKACDTFSAGGG